MFDVQDVVTLTTSRKQSGRRRWGFGAGARLSDVWDGPTEFDIDCVKKSTKKTLPRNVDYNKENEDDDDFIEWVNVFRCVWTVFVVCMCGLLEWSACVDC